MCCCLIGSTAFQRLSSFKAQNVAVGMTFASALSMSVAALSAWRGASFFWPLALGFFAFEACVGFYFPLIGTLRSKLVPDSHRSVIMNLFGIPLNLAVVAVFLGMDRLGVKGALTVSAGGLAVCAAAAASLKSLMGKGEEEKTQI